MTNLDNLSDIHSQTGSLTLGGGGDFVGAAAWMAAGLSDGGLLYAVRDG